MMARAKPIVLPVLSAMESGRGCSAVADCPHVISLVGVSRVGGTPPYRGHPGGVCGSSLPLPLTYLSQVL